MIISPLKRTWPFIWTNLNSLHPRIMCTKFDWIWLAGSEEEDFKKFSMYFYSFAIISPWRRAIPFLWTFTQVWLELVQWFWRRSRKCESLQTDRQTDAGQQAIRKAHLSFQLRWAKKQCTCSYVSMMSWQVKQQQPLAIMTLSIPTCFQCPASNSNTIKIIYYHTITYHSIKYPYIYTFYQHKRFHCWEFFFNSLYSLNDLSWHTVREKYVTHTATTFSKSIC
jgi:hypothetical protein